MEALIGLVILALGIMILLKGIQFIWRHIWSIILLIIILILVLWIAGNVLQ